MPKITRLDFINLLNDFAFTGDYSELIYAINKILSYDDFSEYVDLLEIAFDSSQLYGFLEYIKKDIDKDYLSFKILPYKANTFSFLNCGQLSLLQEIYQIRKVFISAPTSFGKTSIVNEFIIDNNRNLNNIVYIVPTNSLLEEIFLKFLKFNKEFDLNFSISTRPYIDKNKKNFLILTPERFLMLIEDFCVDYFDLILMDEAYKIINFRKEKITDFYDDRSGKFRKVADLVGQSQNVVIFLSPYTYEKTNSMSIFLKNHGIKRINRKVPYVNHNIIPLYRNLDLQNQFNISYTGYSKLNRIKKVIAVLPLLKVEKTIIYVSTYFNAYNIVDLYDHKCDTPKSSERFLAFKEHLNNNYNIDDMEKWKIIEGLEKGIGIYISPVPRYIKKEIVSLFEEGILHTLIVTTSFTEGVNTGAKNIIITSTYTSSNVPLSELDILNIIGRAGRFTKQSVGYVYCITKEIYECVSNLQKNITAVQLNNLNYMKDSNRSDYDIDMVNEYFLDQNQINRKEFINQKQKKLNLSNEELDISLNVPKVWKLILYDYFLSLSEDEINIILDHVNNLISDNVKKINNSISYIFETIKIAFEINSIESTIDPFKTKVYEMRAFSKTGKFTWGILYNYYCNGNIKYFIKHNYEYVTTRFNEIIEKHNLHQATSKRDVEFFFNVENASWILQKYYDNSLIVKKGIFYTEAFKMISSIFEYKIPFYIGYFVSIFKLFYNKNQARENNFLTLDVKDISLQFENGIGYSEYNELIDFGIPSELIKKLRNKNIKVSDILNGCYSKNNFDVFEQMILSDYVSIQ